MIPSVMGSQTSGFITRWTVGAAQTVTLPLVNSRLEGLLSYNCTVNWGDGTPTQTILTYNSANATHTYASAGNYNVEIRGVCEGWSFNNAGSKLAVVAVVYWGDAGGFAGFKYLANGFNGCSNLASLGQGVILASGSGVGFNGFKSTFQNCALVTSIPPNLFKCHAAVSTSAFNSTFLGCSSLASVPTDLFRYNTAASTSGFASTFQGCTALAAIPVDLFRYNPSVSSNGFSATFTGCSTLTSVPADLFRYNVSADGFVSTFASCTSLATLPVDLFRYNTAVTSYAFNNTFNGCSSLATIPTDLFRYNTLVSDHGFDSTFINCSSLVNVPADLFRYNTLVASNGFDSTFRSCTSLATIPADILRYNVACTSFSGTFRGCNKLTIPANVFFEPGEETTRFLNMSVDFTNCFMRSIFTGVQGTAPDLWACDFGSGTPTATTCFGGTGNNTTSLSNYSSIPAGWR